MNLDPWNLDALKPDPRCSWARGNHGQINAYVRELFALWYPDTEDEGACLHWAHAGCCILRLCGYRAILNAGSMNWPINIGAPEPIPTHFSYEWHPQDAPSVAAVAAGNMPEIHIWCALPDTNEIVDFSTGSFRKLATERHGLTWNAPDPPPYLWAKANHLPRGVYYRPDIGAIRFVLQRLERLAEVIEA